MNQVTDAANLGERTHAGAQAYSYTEVFCLKYLSCCRKKSRRHLVYNQHQKIIAERMDVVSFIQNEGNSGILAHLLMRPYQLVLIAHLKKSHELSDKAIAELSINQAVQIARQNLSNQDIPNFEAVLNQELVNFVDHHDKHISLKMGGPDEIKVKKLGASKGKSTLTEHPHQNLSLPNPAVTEKPKRD